MSKISFRGIEYATLKDIAKAHGIAYNTLYDRTKRGMSLEEAVSTPLKKRRIFKYNGREFKSLEEIANEFGICFNTLINRLYAQKLPLEQAIEKPVLHSGTPIEITVDSKKYPSMLALADAYNISIQTLNSRLSAGIPLDLALRVPVNSKKKSA